MSKILIVDDESGIVNMLEMMLEEAGYTTISARDGKEGFEKAVNYRPDLIISDILMPEMDGFVFLKELKQNPATKNTPVLILTARGQMEDSFKAVGADDFVEKPSDAGVLLKKVKELLEKGVTPSKSPLSRKILIGAGYKEVARGMDTLLLERKSETRAVYSGPDVVTEMVLFEPNILILDVQMPELPSHEVIGMIKKLPKFSEMLILTYSYYRVHELGSEAVQNNALKIEECAQKCVDAGANEYWGRYSKENFLKWLDKYL